MYTFVHDLECTRGLYDVYRCMCTCVQLYDIYMFTVYVHAVLYKVYVQVYKWVGTIQENGVACMCVKCAVFCVHVHCLMCTRIQCDVYSADSPV